MKNSRGDFFGRDAELDELEGLWGKRVASLVTCRGRRRIGKSTLVEEFARRSGARFIKLEGLRSRISRRAGVSIRTALVYDGLLAPVAKADGYFDAIVPSSKLLGLE